MAQQLFALEKEKTVYTKEGRYKEKKWVYIIATKPW